MKHLSIEQMKRLMGGVDENDNDEGGGEQNDCNKFCPNGAQNTCVHVCTKCEKNTNWNDKLMCVR